MPSANALPSASNDNVERGTAAVTPTRYAACSPEQLEAEALAFKALGHPTRLLMVRALADGELCVCDLQRLAGIDMSTVSRHLSQLKTAGVLASRRRGNQVLYRLRTPCLIAVMGCIAGVVDAERGAPSRTEHRRR